MVALGGDEPRPYHWKNMPWNLNTTHAAAGDLALLVGLRHKHFIFPILPGGTYHTHRGILSHDDLIGKPWGTQVFSHQGAPFFMLQPSLADLLVDLKRSTQIMYPKDIGFILISLSIGPGQTILEAGTGSGSMTVALAYAVGPQGRVVTYEKRPEFQNLARKNLERLGLDSRVKFKLGDIADGMAETNVDACFLDVPNPWDYVRQVRARSSRVAFSVTLCRPSTRWRDCFTFCGGSILPSLKCVNFCCVTTSRSRPACVPPTGWWRTPAS